MLKASTSKSLGFKERKREEGESEKRRSQETPLIEFITE